MTIHTRKLTTLFFSIFLTGVFSIAGFAAPSNDNLANAQTLAGVAGSVAGSNVDATREQGEELHTTTSTATVYRTVWYQWTAATSAPVVFEIASSAFDASLAVHTGSSYPVSTVTVNNDTNGNRPRVEFTTVAGTTYKIAVGLYNDAGAQGGDFTLNWTVNAAASNDNFASALALPDTPAGNVSLSNQNASKEANEPAHIAGNRSVWVTYTNTQPNDYSVTFTTSRFSGFPDTTLAVYTGSSLGNLVPVVKNDNLPAQSVSRVTFLAKSGTTYRIAVDEGSSPNEWSIVLSWDVTRIKGYTDLGTVLANGQIHYDDAADIAVFRATDGTWWIRNSHTGAISVVRFGLPGDVPVQGDYDGDGRTDLAVARDTPNGKVWYVRNSFDNTYTILQWGVTGDKPVVGDYDADGRVDLAVFRPSTGVWYIRKSRDGQFIIKSFGFGTDSPVVGDFRGTAAGTDIAVYRPSNGTWYVLNGDQTIFIPFGTSEDQPAVADYDFDGRSDVAVFRPSNGTWYVLRSGSNQVQQVKWGIGGDIPVPADYDNNTNDLADFAVFRPSENRWYILRSEGGVTEIQQFGASGDVPVSTPTVFGN
jgi:hypothetical protein